MKRRSSGRTSAEVTRFSRDAVQHAMSHDQQAREHAMVRNRLVVTVLAYAAVLKRRSPLNPDLVKENAAAWQNLRAAQRPRPVGSFDLTWEPPRGYAVMEAAHFLPCSLNYDAADISSLGRNPAEIECLRAPFADVHPLPAVFNDADQWAEDLGLRRAFESAVREILAKQATGASVDLNLIARIYLHEWKSKALMAYDAALAKLEPLRAREVQRRHSLVLHRQALTVEDMTPDEDASFYDDMFGIIGAYRRATATTAPINLKNSDIEGHVRELETAGEE
jgi:hypothetical protein